MRRIILVLVGTALIVVMLAFGSAGTAVGGPGDEPREPGEQAIFGAYWDEGAVVVESDQPWGTGAAKAIDAAGDTDKAGGD